MTEDGSDHAAGRPTGGHPLLAPVPTIELVSVTKAFPGVVALDDVDLDVFDGEVHAVIGLNGAGKSTLVNVLAGSLEPDEGTLRASGNPVVARTWSRQISLVPQEIVVVPNLSIGRNVLLGGEGFTTRADLSRAERTQVAAAFERLGLDLDPDTVPEECSIPELRLAQIARALMSPGEVMLLDEPTAVLSHTDAARLLERLRLLRSQGEAIVYVSHRLTEVLGIADRITVLRDGRNVMTLDRSAVDRDELLDILIGSSRSKEAAERDFAAVHGTPLLSVDGLSGPGLRGASVRARRGEVVALVGVPSGGQSRFVQTLAGVRSATSGSVRVDEQEISIGSIADSFRAGFVLVPADRRDAGVVGSLSVVENIVLSPGSLAKRWGIRRRRQENQIVDGYLDAFGVRSRSRDAAVATLSGGNQQKVAIAKALEAQPRLLLLDEPTQGIDVASKGDILDDIKWEARSSGRAVLAATSELEEVVGWADTVYVFRLGEVVAQITGTEVAEEALIELSVP